MIARAVAEMATLVNMAGHHVGEGGVFVALKGRYPADEIDTLPDPREARVHLLSVPGLEQGSRHLVQMQRRAGENEERI